MAITPTSRSMQVASSASASARYIGSAHRRGYTGNITVSRSHRRRASLKVAGAVRSCPVMPANRVGAPIAQRDDPVDGVGSGVEHLEVGHAVGLVEVEDLAPEQAAGVVELGLDPVGVRPQRLAGDEEPVADGGHQRADHPLGVAVLRRDVEVVHAGVERQLEGGSSLLGGGGGPEGGAAEDGDARLVLRAPEAPSLHAAP